MLELATNRPYSSHHINRSSPQAIVTATNIRRPTTSAIYDHNFNQQQYSPPPNGGQQQRNQRCFLPVAGGATYYNQAYAAGAFNHATVPGSGFYAMQQQHQQPQQQQHLQHHQQMVFHGKQKRWGSPNVPQKRHLAGSPPRASLSYPLAQIFGE